MVAKKGGKKRFWPEEQKRSICAQTRTPGVSVAQVARRDAMNANLIHKWLRDPRFALDEVTPETAGVSALSSVLSVVEGLSVPSGWMCAGAFCGFRAT
jgi:transposase